MTRRITSETLRRGLEIWRKKELMRLEEENHEAAEEWRRREDGLRIVAKNPGVIAEDVIEYLMEKMAEARQQMDFLEQEHQELMEMPLAELTVRVVREQRK